MERTTVRGQAERREAMVGGCRMPRSCLQSGGHPSSVAKICERAGVTQGLCFAISQRDMPWLPRRRRKSGDGMWLRSSRF